MRTLPILVVVAATISGPGCGSSDLILPTPGEPAAIKIVGGDEQQGPAGLTLSGDLIVQVLDEAGTGVPGQAVTWVVATGGGSVTPETGTTDVQGHASARWTLGPSAGRNTVSAVVAVVGGVTFSATATDGDGGGDPASIEAVEGQDQSAPAGTAVPVEPTVRVLDDGGAPVEGVQVTFVVTEGGGNVTGASQTTNAGGIARVDLWTLGAAPGPNTLEARAGSLDGSPVLFTAEAVAPATVARYVFRIQPREVTEDERFTVEVALVDEAGNLVPVSGVLMYLGLFRQGNDTPSNGDLEGGRFQTTESGVAVFDDLRVTREDEGYRFRALSDDLPAVGPAFSDPFDVN